MSEAKDVLERAIEHWNAGDRDCWQTLYADDVVYEAPGGHQMELSMQLGLISGASGD